MFPLSINLDSWDLVKSRHTCLSRPAGKRRRLQMDISPVVSWRIFLEILRRSHMVILLHRSQLGSSRCHNTKVIRIESYSTRRLSIVITGHLNLGRGTKVTSTKLALGRFMVSKRG